MEDRQVPTDAEERARYKRVIRAADELFRRVGFRGVTMEAVARDAAVAKATLYSYFRNKDELFMAVSSRMAEGLRQGFADALAAAEGKTLDERIAAAIVARRGALFAYMASSAHAEDLISHKHQLAGGIFVRADEAMLRLLTGALREDPKLRPSAARLARALFYGSAQLGSHSTSRAALEAELEAFVMTHLVGARALAGRT
jgi:AcrR family transcriptional regulator